MNKVEEFQIQMIALQSLREAAIQEAELMLENVREEQRRLEALLAELKGEPTSGEATTKKGTRSRDPLKPCVVCNFVTTPNHDARTHRFQDLKKPFSSKELIQRKLSKLH